MANKGATKMTSKDVELLMSQRRNRRNSHVAFRLIPQASTQIDENDLVTEYDLHQHLSSSGSLKDSFKGSLRGGRVVRSVYTPSLVDDAFCKSSFF